MPAAKSQKVPSKSEYKDKEKPTQIRISNIEAAKGRLFTIVTEIFVHLVLCDNFCNEANGHNLFDDFSSVSFL